MVKDDHNLQEAKNPENVQEKRDLNAKAIVLFGGFLLAACLVAIVILGGLFSYFLRREMGLDQSSSPLSVANRRTLPPEPRLQLAPGHEKSPMQDLTDLRAAEDAILNSYGWVQQPSGIVHIPIEEAKKLLLARGLSVRHAPSGISPENHHEQLPAVSSSGRVVSAGRP
jgi:hypothetical protein